MDGPKARGTAAKRTGLSVPSYKPSGPAVVDRGQQASRFTLRAGLVGRTSGLPAAGRTGPLGPSHDFLPNHLPFVLCFPSSISLSFPLEYQRCIQLEFQLWQIGKIDISISFHLEYQHRPFQVRSTALCSPFSILLFASDCQQSID